MTVVQTTAVFAGIPASVILVIALLTYVPSTRNSKRRYRPGMPWEFHPVWYLAPERADGRRVLHGVASRPELTAARGHDVVTSNEQGSDVKGGAHGSW